MATRMGAARAIPAPGPLERSFVERFEPFIEARGLTFPVLLDPRSRAQRAYGVGAIPTSFLVDRRGRIALRQVGAADWDSSAARGLVERLLAEPAAGNRAEALAALELLREPARPVPSNLAPAPGQPPPRPGTVAGGHR